MQQASGTRSVRVHTANATMPNLTLSIHYHHHANEPSLSITKNILRFLAFPSSAHGTMFCMKRSACVIDINLIQHLGSLAQDALGGDALLLEPKQ